MSDSGKKKTLSLGGGEPLRLKQPGEGGGAPSRGGMGGGRKTVKVEVRRRRAPARGSQAPEASSPVASPEPVKQPAAAAEKVVEASAVTETVAPAPAAPAPPATADAGPGRTRHVLKTLSTEEKSARARALENAQAADQAARARAEENALRQAKEAARVATEREAAETRRHEEEARKKSEDDSRKKSEEEAARKLQENEAKAEAEAAAHGDTVGKRPSPAAGDAAGRRVERRPVERPKPTPRARTEPRRRAGRITVTEALADREERVRSLTSIRRERERRKQLAAESGESQGKILREVVVPETITVQELANRMAERGVDVVRSLMGLGVMATVNQTIDADTAELVVAEFGHRLRRVSESDVEIGLKGDADDQGDLQARAPVVTVMGHVDHGKTSLLDAIREADVAAGEAGGITQHIGAYQVTTPAGSKITFIDTPGHAAFTAMRARGAQVTDLVVLVVAADDGVMPQTIEAINHAKAANVPLIVAVNKMDLPDANPNKVKQELLQHEVIPEEMGGEVQIVEVSAIKKQNLDGLEEVIQLQAELLELQANPNRPAEGVVVEAKLDRGRGAVATILVQRGTLSVGDIFVAGGQWGRVRALLDSHGDHVESAGPSMPVEVLGLNGAPGAGEEFNVVESEARAREVAEYRQRVERERRATAGARGSLEEMFSNLSSSETKEFPLLFKADVRGSLEAITSAVENLGNDEVSARVLHGGVGGITESDIDLARASNAVVIGFNVRANPQAKEMARQENVDIRYYSIIYELVDDLRKAMSGLLEPEIRETVIGGAEVLEVFSISKLGKIAGCRINNGLARRQAKVRLLRDDVVIHTGSMKSLKRFKDDASEVREGNECGVALESYQDIQAGDQLEFFEVEEVERSL
ncbi:MAG: translation initiation factor IF-2 [Rhodospirillaceae bacterium]|nr:translation initiation factor IF-2 [Rhodospirillaceae bacterium]MBT7757213.1 translation initiation factor IF-2 [Rhodospirillaceae bacterium]